MPAEKGSLKGETAGNIATQLGSMVLAWDKSRIDDPYNKTLGDHMTALLQQWLDENQVTPEREELREIAQKVHDLREHWRAGMVDTKLLQIEKMLHAVTGCPHPIDTAEIGGVDDKGWYIVCAKCGSITHDLRTWESPQL